MYLFLFNLPIEYYLRMMGKPKTWKGSGQMMANGKGHRETLWMMKRRRKMINGCSGKIRCHMAECSRI